jgi:Flp pilus assembly protein CpaB
MEHRIAVQDMVKVAGNIAPKSSVDVLQCARIKAE